MENCLFCKIINNEIKSYEIYEDKNFKVILDKFPATLGHTLIIPKMHIENIFYLEDDLASKIFVLTKKIAISLKESLKVEGINILQNNGQIAGQTVYHFHMHLIPRYKDDKVKVGWETIKEETLIFESTLDSIKNYVL